MGHKTTEVQSTAVERAIFCEFLATLAAMREEVPNTHLSDAREEVRERLGLSYWAAVGAEDACEEEYETYLDATRLGVGDYHCLNCSQSNNEAFKEEPWRHTCEFCGCALGMFDTLEPEVLTHRPELRWEAWMVEDHLEEIQSAESGVLPLR